MRDFKNVNDALTRTQTDPVRLAVADGCDAIAAAGSKVPYTDLEMSAANPSVFGQLAAIGELEFKRSPSTFSMPAHTILEMELNGVETQLIERLFGPRRKIKNLYKTNENLSQEQTDRAMRVVRIVDLAERVFKNRTKAMAWLKRDHKLLRSKPFDLLGREGGANLVEEALLRIAYGIVA